MNRLIIILIFFAALNCLNAQTGNDIDPNGYNIFYYPSGAKASEGPFRNGKPDGFWKTYYENGKIKSEGKRLNYLLDSLWTFYDEDGFVSTKISYRDDKKNGYTFVYKREKNKAGKEIHYLFAKELYLDNVMQGNSFYYYPTGELFQIVHFENGKRHEIAKEFSKDSVLIGLIRYRNDFIIEQEQINRKDKAGLKQGVWKEFHLNDQLKTEAFYKNDSLHGIYREYNKLGEMINFIQYKMGKVTEEIIGSFEKIDQVKKYHDNGKIKFAGNYKNGVPVGTHIDYDTEGKITATRIYNENGLLTAEGILTDTGKKTGNWKFYYPSGEIMEEGEYKNNKRTGDWKFYYPSGKVEQTGSYIAGNETGTWKFYAESGQLLMEENYLKGKREGAFREFDRNGLLINEGEFYEDNKTGIWTHHVNDHKETGEYKDDYKEGNWKYYYPEEKLKYTGSFILGQENGKHKRLYSDGNVMEEGKYLMGKKEGNWKYYNPDGSVHTTVQYKNGIETKIDGVKIQWPE
ncbi:MAG: hypothetical protein JXR58_05165 [Bacteroidales bacterium]|nr:hypothetical protein [Bacteroidales bacterium]